MMETAYQARKNPRGIDDEAAGVLGAELDRLEDKLGHDPTNREVLDAARAKKNPWHDRLEWDDGVAAEQHRLQQIRCDRGCIAVIVKTDDAQVFLVPRTIVVEVRSATATEDGEPGEVEVDRVRCRFADALTDDEIAADIIRTLYKRVNGYRDQLAVFDVFSDLVSEIDRLGHEDVMSG